MSVIKGVGTQIPLKCKNKQKNISIKKEITTEKNDQH